MKKIIILIIVCIFSIQNASAIEISSDDPKHDKKFDIADNTNIKVMDAPDGSGGYLFYSTGAHINKQKVTVAKNKIKKLATFTHGWHKDDSGNVRTIIIPVSEKSGNYEFDVELSSTCVDCYIGTYLQTFTALNSTITSTFSQSLTNISSLHANITDYSMLSDPYSINTSGLVGWWHLDETTGTNLADSSGSGNNGTWNGNTTLNTTTGKYNNALAFDGINDYVSFAPVNLSQFTVSMWVYPLSTTGSHTLISSGISGNANDSLLNFYIYTSGTNVYGRYGNGINLSYVTTSSTPFKNNSLNYIVLTLNNTNLSIYVDGILKKSTPRSYEPYQLSNKLLLGIRKESGTNYPFIGTIDEVLIYNHSLTASEISSLYYTHLQELQITATGNGTPSENWNGTNPINIPSSYTDTITGLTYIVPSSATINGIVVNDYRNTTKWNLTATAAFTENTTTITEASVSGYYYYNGSLLPGMDSDSGQINLTITDETFITSAHKGSASMTSNNANLSFSYTYPYFKISTGPLNNSSTNTYNITIPYNNPPITSILPETSFYSNQNVIINTSASDPEGNTLSCHVKVNGVEMTSCAENDFGSLPEGTYTIYFNVTEAATVSPEWVNITSPLNVTQQQISEYVPPSPANISSIPGNFFINTTWETGVGNIIDSYNVSVNGIFTNESVNTYVNSTLSAHVWQNVTVYAFNASGAGTLNSSPAILNTQIPNNNPVQAEIGDKTVTGNQNLNFSINTTDADNDVITYGANNSRGSFNSTTGEFTWTPALGDVGVYTWNFNSSDGYGGVANEIITVTVTTIPTYTVSGYVFNNTGSGLEGVLVNNGSNGSTTISSGYYSISGFVNASYNFSYSKDGFTTGYLVVTIDGANNTTANMTIYDNAPPASVTDLSNVSYARNYINWTWIEPQDTDFNKVMVYLNGAHQGNVSKGVKYFNATDLVPGTYTIGTRTVDIYDNINATTVTQTATTILPMFRFINGTVIDSINKTGILGVTLSTDNISTITNATGFYSFNVTAGTFNLTASLNPTYYTNSSVIVSTELNAITVQDIELIKKPTGTITGIVTNT